MEVLSQSLSETKIKALREWLLMSQAETLFSILQSRVFKLECEASADLIAAIKDGVERSQLELRAKANARDAEFYSNAIKMLKEIRDVKADHCTYTAMPHLVENQTT